MRVEETSFLNEYIAMADYGDRLGWHERNGGNFTYWMKPENVADVKDELHDKGEWLPIGTNQRHGKVFSQYEKGFPAYNRHHTG